MNIAIVGHLQCLCNRSSRMRRIKRQRRMNHYHGSYRPQSLTYCIEQPLAYVSIPSHVSSNRMRRRLDCFRGNALDHSPLVVTVLLKTKSGKIICSTNATPPPMKKGDASATLTLDYANAKRRYLGHPPSVGRYCTTHVLLVASKALSRMIISMYSARV